MKKIMKKTIAFFLVAAMLVMNLGAFVFAAESDTEKKEEISTKVSAPEASVKGGTYTDTQKITLTTKTKDGVIYYTLNGDTPTEKSTKFDAKKPIEVKETTTVKAIAVKEGMKTSDAASFVYTITKADAAKTPENTKTSETPAAPADPTQSPSEEGEAALAPPKTTTGVTGLKDENLKDPGENITSAALQANNIITAGSELTVQTAAEYTLTAAPESSSTITSLSWAAKETQTGAAFEEGKSYICTVTLTPAANFVFPATGTTFTLNGVNSATTTIAQDGTSATLTFELTVPAAPTASPASGETVKEGSKVTLSSVTAGAAIKYTTGTDTTEIDYPADGVEVKGDADKKFSLGATAYLNGFASSKADFQYTVEEAPVKPEAPKASKEGGTYEGKQSITLTAASGAEIRYTTDGSEPTATHGTVYSKAIEISKDTTLKAVAVSAGVVSDVAEFNYTITEKPSVKHIEKVEITDLTAGRGKKFDKKVSVSSASHSTVESVVWTDADGNTVSGRLKAGTVYYAYITLKAKSGYEYVENETANLAKTTATVNNSTAGTVISTFKNEKEIVVCWGYKTAAAATAAASGNTITGVKSSYTKGSTVSFKATGATTSAEEGNERYIPVKYKISTSEFDIKDGETSVDKAFKISSTGTFTLYVYFQKQTYNSETEKWENAGSSQDVKSVSFKVTSTTASTTKKTTTTTTTTPKKTSTSTTSKAKNAKTGDETPVGAYAAALLLAGGAIAFTVVRKRKKSI